MASRLKGEHEMTTWYDYWTKEKYEKAWNCALPDGAEILGELSQCSGEIVWTYYSLNGRFYKLCDWVYSIPQEIAWDDIPAVLKDGE